MAHFDSTIENLRFPLRRDRNGVRAVYKLGNEGGPCPFACTFCGVGNSPRVDPAENRARFDRLFADYSSRIDEPYHAAIFNEGNVPNPREFSRETLQHVLGTLAQDAKVQFVSLNSRESTATAESLKFIRDLELPFPIHFIFGLETLSGRGREILGKDNEGELERFLAKLKTFNGETGPVSPRKPYLFGLDINLVFLPEIYLKPGEERCGRESQIHDGFLEEFRSLLSQLDATVPCQINIHPYYEVPSLPYRDADLLQLLRILPDLQGALEEYNEQQQGARVDLFLGVVLLAPDQDGSVGECYVTVDRAIADFNATGRLPLAPWPHGSSRTASSH